MYWALFCISLQRRSLTLNPSRCVRPSVSVIAACCIKALLQNNYSHSACWLAAFFILIPPLSLYLTSCICMLLFSAQSLVSVVAADLSSKSIRLLNDRPTIYTALTEGKMYDWLKILKSTTVVFVFSFWTCTEDGSISENSLGSHMVLVKLLVSWGLNYGKKLQSLIYRRRRNCVWNCTPWKSRCKSAALFYQTLTEGERLWSRQQRERHSDLKTRCFSRALSSAAQCYSSLDFTCISCLNGSQQPKYLSTLASSTPGRPLLIRIHT